MTQSVAVSAAPRPRVAPGEWLTLLLPVASVLLFLALWSVSTLFSRFMPSPTDTLRAIQTDLVDPETYRHLWVSVVRAVVGVGLAMLVGVAVGVLMGYHRYLAAFFGLYVSVGLTIPSLAWAFIALLLFGPSEAGVYFATAIVVYPFVAVHVWEGVKALDTGLLEMARVFRAPRWQTIRDVVLPGLMPYLTGAARNAFALGWKIVIVAEIFGRTNGIGYQYHFWYTQFRMGQVLAWAVLFILLVTVFEYVILQRLEARLFRWRSAVGAAST